MAIIVKSRDSLLTTSSGYTNYRGILNLVIILLILSNARAALENVIKYGILVDPLSWFLFLGERSKHWPSLMVMLGLGVHILISLCLEKIIAQFYQLETMANAANGLAKGAKKKKMRTVLLANVGLSINLFACLSLPPLVIYTNDTHPISTSAALMLVSIVFLKLVSYHMLNYWCRDSRRPEKLQSRTTKSFLRSYIPPATDFGAKPECQAAAATKNGASSNGAPPPPKGKQFISETANGQDLRQRLSTTHNNNNNNNSSSPTNGVSKANGRHEPRAQATSDQNRSPTHQAGGCCAKEQAAMQALADYPNNITLRNMCAFMVFPTLCYELEYAKTARLRKRFLIKRILELIILSQLDMALIQQWIVPTVHNSVISFRQMQLSHMLERLLKLAIPNHVIWLIWFYMFFHSLLNIMAELTRFADREFYRDWWNSESVYYFWSNWNIPVHKWCARHLYVPLMSLGLNKCQASTAVFFVSAFFHEYLVSVPLKMFRMWAFTGMLIQLPLARFVSSYFNSYFANVAVWVSLIIGQPLCILMYYHDYYVNSIANQKPANVIYDVQDLT